MATKGNVLRMKRKIELLKEIETKKMKQADDARKFKVCQGTVSLIVKNAEALKPQLYGGTNAQRKRERLPVESKVDSALLSWFKKARANNMPIKSINKQAYGTWSFNLKA